MSFIYQVAAIFHHLRLSSWPEEVRVWPGNELLHVQHINDALLSYDKYYSLIHHSGKYLRKTTIMYKLIHYPDNCFMSKCKFQFWLCGKSSCDLCLYNHIQTIITPDENILRQVLKFMDLPVVDLYNKEIFLSPKDSRKRGEEVLSISEQPKYLPILK